MCWLRMLSNIPVGASYVWVVSNLLWAFMCSTAIDVWRWLIQYNVCSMTDLGMQKVLKEFETAVRRTGRWYDWIRMDVDDMGKIVNANLFVGRGRFAVEWQPEYNNRCDNRYKLLYYHNNNRE